jgi:hypothetical protein
MSRSWTKAPYLIAILTASALLGCGDSVGSTAGPANGLTEGVGATTRDEVEAALSAMTLPTSLAPIGTTQAAPTTAAAFMAGCVNPSSATDADGDGVPNDATYVFTAPPCRFTGWRGGTLDMVGQLRIQDPTPSNAGFGYEGTLTGLRSRFTSADNKVIYDVTRNGTRTLSGSTESLQLTEDVQVVRTFVGHPDATIDKQWTVTFTPATQLQINAEVPSGSVTVTGTLDWSRGDEHVMMTLTTPTPLQYDAGCTTTVQRIKAGEIQAAGDFDGSNGFVRVRWNGCGEEPAFTFVGGG